MKTCILALLLSVLASSCVTTAVAYDPMYYEPSDGVYRGWSRSIIVPQSPPYYYGPYHYMPPQTVIIIAPAPKRIDAVPKPGRGPEKNPVPSNRRRGRNP